MPRICKNLNNKDNDCDDSDSSSEESDIDNTNNKIMDEYSTQLHSLQKQNDNLYQQIEESNMKIDSMLKSISSNNNNNNLNNNSNISNNDFQVYSQMIHQQYTQLKQLMRYVVCKRRFYANIINKLNRFTTHNKQNIFPH